VNGEDNEDDQEFAELGLPDEDDEPSWVMGAISKTVPQPIDCFWQMLIMIDESTQLG